MEKPEGKKGGTLPPRTSLVWYEWASADFHFRLTESCEGLLLQARPKRGPFDPDKGVPAAQVAALLKRLVNLDATDADEEGAVSKGWSVQRTFHLLPRVSRGVPFHNMPRDPRYKDADPRYQFALADFARHEPLWPRCIVGFLSADALCVVIPKCDAILAYPGIPFDADWLRDALMDKDGKTRLHQPLRERPWPSGK